MRQPNFLLDEASRRIDLDRMLADGKGGEGAVFGIQGVADQVVKVYHTPPDAEKVQKLRYMCQSLTPALAKVTAWPSRIVCDPRTRSAVGFVMPRADGKDIWKLFQPPERSSQFQFATWAFQVRAAANLAAAVDEVHTAGHVIGDFNLKNAFVAKNGLVRLIDCDSYQIRTPHKHFLCDVGMPDYTPPELQGNAPRGTGRTRNHDNFSLAVLIYQLLFLGKHPYMGNYSGRDEPSLFDFIRGYMFSQGAAAQTWSMAPPLFSPTFDDIPSDVGLLFRRAFERGSQNDSRPTAAEWHKSLQHLEPQIVECEEDPGHRYWRGQRVCVWCRIESQIRVPLYFGAGGGSADTFEVDEAKLLDVIRRLSEIETERFDYDRDKYAPKQAPKPRSLPDGISEHQAIQTILAITCGASATVALTGFFFKIVGTIGAISCLVFGVWLFIVWWRSPWRAELRRRGNIRDRAKRYLLELEDEWSECVEKYTRRDYALRKRVRENIRDCRDLEAEYTRTVGLLGADAHRTAFERHLRLHSIFDGNIESIGMKRKQALHSAGIRTAADVEESTIRSLHGFGPKYTERLMQWKSDIVRKFRFDPATAVSPKDRKDVAVRYRRRQKEVLSQIESTLNELRTLGPAHSHVLGKLIPQLREALAEYDQAESDLIFMAQTR